MGTARLRGQSPTANIRAHMCRKDRLGVSPRNGLFRVFPYIKTLSLVDLSGSGTDPKVGFFLFMFGLGSVPAITFFRIFVILGTDPGGIPSKLASMNQTKPQLLLKLGFYDCYSCFKSSIFSWPILMVPL